MHLQILTMSVLDLSLSEIAILTPKHTHKHTHTKICCRTSSQDYQEVVLAIATLNLLTFAFVGEYLIPRENNYIKLAR